MTEDAEERAFVSPRQLAERWDCKPTTAQRIAARAGIAKYLLGEGRNGMVRYALAEVEAYEDSRRIESGAHAVPSHRTFDRSQRHRV